MKNLVQLIHLIVSVSLGNFLDINSFLHLTSLFKLYAGAVSLKMVMGFFSGADDIPPMGYPHEPLINFNPDSPFPTASTCALQLTLPTYYSEYGPFKSALDTAFTMHGGFGMS